MRLVNLTIRNFRGFGSSALPIPLHGDLLLFYGPNGFGKTSLAEAIEWLFYGMTKRRQLGDGYSRSEYANSFANIHGGTPTDVAATVEIAGRQTVLSRRLGAGETSQTFVDGVQAPFSSVNVSPIEAFYPVVAQHGLQTFVHSKPKDRRDAICAAFGLDELTALKNTLDSARASFQRTPPRSIADARRELATNARTLSELEETKELARRWQLVPPQVKLDEDAQSLLSAARALSGAECPTVTDALASLREMRIQAGRSVFDVEKIAAGEGVLTTLGSERDVIAQSLTEVERAIAASAAAMASTYKSAFLELWKKGLELSPSGDQCPLCEADTLNDAKRAELSKRLADNADRLQKNDVLRSAVNLAKARIASYRSRVQEFGVVDLTADDIEQLRRLFAKTPDEFDAFLPRSKPSRLREVPKAACLMRPGRFWTAAPTSLKFPTRCQKLLRDRPAPRMPWRTRRRQR